MSHAFVPSERNTTRSRVVTFVVALATVASPMFREAMLTKSWFGVVFLALLALLTARLVRWLRTPVPERPASRNTHQGQTPA